MTLRLARLHLLGCALALSCGSSGGPAGDGGASADARPDTPADSWSDAAALGPLRFNELVADDEGVLIDEEGQTSDWLELVNAGAVELELGRFTLETGGGRRLSLPARTLRPGATVVLWASGVPGRGPLHLDTKLSADKGERLVLRDAEGRVTDEVLFPALGPNEAWARFPDGSGAFASCPLATPGRANGTSCSPPPPPALPEEVRFQPFAWPAGWGAPAGPLVITEVALDGAAPFVEVLNAGVAAVAADGFVLRLDAQTPGQALPGPTGGAPLPWPVAAIAPGARAVVPLPADARAALGAAGEGVVSLFRRGDGGLVDRAAFMQLPPGAALVRLEEGAAPARAFQICGASSPGRGQTTCSPAPPRPAFDRLRALAAPSDFSALAAGGTGLDGEAVKFLVDMQAGDAVHLLGAGRWALHYTFVREAIDRAPALDRCDPQQAAIFYDAWVAFSEREYFKSEGRRYLLGTLVRYGGSGLRTVEFAQGDAITGAQMRRAFFAVAAALPDPERWAVRPQDASQVAASRAAEGTLPLVDPNAPFRGQTYQPLTASVGYGVLRFVPGEALAGAALGPDVIVVTDHVPNDLPLSGGLITEAFQTPLSHVNVLSKNRGTPNMALAGARTAPRLAPFWDQLVRLEVKAGDFDLRVATAEEAQAFYEERRPKGPPLSPRLDTSVRALVDLGSSGLYALPSVGAKAAQLAELVQLSRTALGCAAGLPLPEMPFAVPVVHAVEHFVASGAAARLERLRADPAFRADPRARAAGLAELQRLVREHPVAPALMVELEAAIRARFGTAPVRLRSSSNTEDLVGFSGAGLYESLSVAAGDPDRRIEDGLRAIWASLWRSRAYDERELAHIDHGKTAMGVLVHAAFPNERANGVAISRDVTDPNDGSAYYFNAQAGEASVTNPAPGVTSEEGIYASWRDEPVRYRSRSSIAPPPVVKPVEVSALMCALGKIHDHFRARLDPEAKNRWFAVDIEWKLLGPERRLLIKQARPHSFGNGARPTDCREF